MFESPTLKFSIQNRESIRSYAPPIAKSVLVRIASGDGTFEDTSHGFDDVLLIKFDDAGPDDPEGTKGRLLNTNIRRFTRTHMC